MERQVDMKADADVYGPRPGSERDRPRLHTPSGSRNLLREDPDSRASSPEGSRAQIGPIGDSSDGLWHRHRAHPERRFSKREDSGSQDPPVRILHPKPLQTLELVPPHHPHSSGTSPSRMASATPSSRRYVSPVGQTVPLDMLKDFSRGPLTPSLDGSVDSRHPVKHPERAARNHGGNPDRHLSVSPPLAKAVRPEHASPRHDPRTVDLRDRYSASPPPRSGSSSAAQLGLDRRHHGGTIASFFKGPHHGAHRGRTRVARSPPPSVPHATTDSRYPTAPPPLAQSSRAPSPPANRGVQGPIWFALDPPSPRPHPSWSSEAVQLYERGFDDAVRAMENGWVRFGDVQQRHPVAYRRNQQSDRLPLYDDTYNSSRSARTSESSGIHFDRQSRTYPYSGPSSPLQSRHPFPTAPYSYGYRIPPYRTPPPTHDGATYHDPYYQSNHYPVPTSSGIGMGPGRSQRQLISCYPCRSRKLKCDGIKPCIQCVRRGNESECNYATHIRRRGKGKKAMDDEQDRSSQGSRGDQDQDSHERSKSTDRDREGTSASASGRASIQTPPVSAPVVESDIKPSRGLSVDSVSPTAADDLVPKRSPT